LLRSENLSLAPWTTANGLTVTNSQTSPSGTATAVVLTPQSGTNASTIYQDVVVSANTKYTFSFYAKLGTMSVSDFKIAIFNSTSASFIAIDIVPTVVPNSSSWVRIVYTFTTPVGCVSARVYPFRNSGAVTGTLYVWGAQLETGSKATSYIPTTSSTVIRAADSCSLTNGSFSNLYNSTEGTIVLDFSPASLDSLQGFYAIHGTVRSLGGHAAYSSGTNSSVTAYSYTSNYESTILSTVTGITSNRIKIAHGYKTNDGAISINGNQAEYDNSYSVPTDMTGLVLGADGFNNTPKYSSVLISDFKLYRKRISNDLMRVHSTL
jgi:hypothetical protein